MLIRRDLDGSVKQLIIMIENKFQYLKVLSQPIDIYDVFVIPVSKQELDYLPNMD